MTLAGFTLVETLVAMAVLAIAAVALVQVQAQSVRTFTAVETSALAQIVAENQMTESLIAQTPLGSGNTSGTVDLGGRTWRWSMEVSATNDPELKRVEIGVRPQDEEGEAATLIGFTTKE